MRTFNLTHLAQEADKAEGGNSGDWFTPPKGSKFPVRVKVAKWSVSEDDVPSWWVALEVTEGEHKGESIQLPLRLGKMDFANKRTFNNLRALGIRSFENVNAEVVAELIKGAEAEILIVWGENKKGGDPWANHELSAKTLDIPEDDDDEDY